MSRSLALALCIAVAMGGAAAKGTEEGTCDADAKGVIDTGKKLSAELAAMQKVRALLRACVRACVRVCVLVCVCAWLLEEQTFISGEMP
jgi:hypothetical protein